MHLFSMVQTSRQRKSHEAPEFFRTRTFMACFSCLRLVCCRVFQEPFRGSAALRGLAKFILGDFAPYVKVFRTQFALPPIGILE
jgi:hypothetical protein